MTSLKEQLRAAKRNLEIAIIRRSLKAWGGNITYTARALQISRKSLQLKMKAYGLRA